MSYFIAIKRSSTKNFYLRDFLISLNTISFVEFINASIRGKWAA